MSTEGTYSEKLISTQKVNDVCLLVNTFLYCENNCLHSLLKVCCNYDLFNSFRSIDALCQLLHFAINTAVSMSSDAFLRNSH